MLSKLASIYYNILFISKQIPLKFFRWIYLKFRKRYIELFLYVQYLEITQSALYLALRNVYIDRIKNNPNKTGFIGKWVLILLRKPFSIFEIYPIVYLTDRKFRETAKTSLLYKKEYLRVDYRHYDLFVFIEIIIIFGGLISLNVRTLGQYFLTYVEMFIFFITNLVSQFFFGLHIEKLLDNWIGHGIYTKCRSLALYQQAYLELHIWFTPNAYWLYYTLFAVCLVSLMQVITFYEDIVWYMVDSHGFTPTTPYLIFGDTNSDGPLSGVANVTKAFILTFVFLCLGYPHVVIFCAVYVMLFVEGLWVAYQMDFPIDEELGGELVKKEQLRDRIYEMMQNSSELLGPSFRREQLFEYFLKDKLVPFERSMIDAVEPIMQFIVDSLSNMGSAAFWIKLPEFYRKLIPVNKVGPLYEVIYLIEEYVSQAWGNFVIRYTENNFQLVKDIVADFYEIVIYRGIILFDFRVGGEVVADYDDYFDGHFDRDALYMSETYGVENTDLEEEEHEAFFKEVFVTRATEAEELLNLRSERDRLTVLEDYVPGITQKYTDEKLAERKRLRLLKKGIILEDTEQTETSESADDQNPYILTPTVKAILIEEFGQSPELLEQAEGELLILPDEEDYDVDALIETKKPSVTTTYKKKINKVLGGTKAKTTHDPFDHQQRIQNQSEEQIDDVDMEFMVEEHFAQMQDAENADVLGAEAEQDILYSRKIRMATIHSQYKLLEDWAWFKLNDEFDEEVFEELFNQSDIPYELYTKYFRWQIMTPFIIISAGIVALLGPAAFPHSDLYNFYDFGCPESIDANRPYSWTEYVWLFDQWWLLGDPVFELYIDHQIPPYFNYRLYELIKMESLLTGVFDVIPKDTPKTDEFWEKYFEYKHYYNKNKHKLNWTFIQPWVDWYLNYAKIYIKYQFWTAVNFIVYIILYFWYNYILWEILEIKNFYVEVYYIICDLWAGKEPW